MAMDCVTCRTPLHRDQDWCVECGTAQPGRLGGRRAGWRAAASVVGATVVLAGGATAASYAALSSDAARDATAPPAGGAPVVAQAPAVPAPPPETTPAPVAPPAGVAPAPSTAPPPPVKPPAAPKAPPAPAPRSSPTTTSSTPPPAAKPEPAAIALAAGAASTYDPEDRGAGRVGKPARAVDGKRSTAWSAPVDDQGAVQIGLLLSLPEARRLSKLELNPDTPGFDVEVYATNSGKVPPDVLDPRWDHVDTVRDVGLQETVRLGGRYRHVLLWITEQPAASRAAIAEARLYG